jgi:hypothetical protein
MPNSRKGQRCLLEYDWRRDWLHARAGVCRFFAYRQDFACKDVSTGLGRKRAPPGARPVLRVSRIPSRSASAVAPNVTALGVSLSSDIAAEYSTESCDSDVALLTVGSASRQSDPGSDLRKPPIHWVEPNARALNASVNAVKIHSRMGLDVRCLSVRWRDLSARILRTRLPDSD